MTLFTRVATIAAISFGLAGLAAVGAPVLAAQAAGDTTGAAAAAGLLLPGTAFRAEIPTVAAVASNAGDDDQPSTALDLADADPSPFQSLAAAVAGQVAPGDPSAELRCLAGAVYHEAKGEPLAGQLAVAEVIINRARSGRFPRSLCGVVTQVGQFSFVRGGAVPAVNPALVQWKTALAVAQVALEDDWESPAANALFFHARRAAPGWDKPRVASIGNHIFYR